MSYDEDDGDEFDSGPYLVIGAPRPRQWSWWLAGSMALECAGKALQHLAVLPSQVAIAMVAHAEYQRDRAEMAEEGALEIEQLTTGGTV